MELEKPVVSSFANGEAIGLAAAEVLALVSEVANKKAEETNTAACFRTSEASSSGSRGGNADAYSGAGRTEAGEGTYSMPCKFLNFYARVLSHVLVSAN